MATFQTPKAAAQEAFISIKAITPDFTAFPMFLPTGNWMAISSGVKIIKVKGTIKISADRKLPLVCATIRMAAITTVYSPDAK